MDAKGYDLLLQQLERQARMLRTHLSQVEEQIVDVRRAREEATTATADDGDDDGNATVETSSPAKKKRRLPVCAVIGCANTVKSGGVCTRHGASRQRCSADGCARYAQRRGLCTRHGAIECCTVEGCTSQVRTRGKCRRHLGGSSGKRPKCRERWCVERVQDDGFGGYCRKHYVERMAEKQKEVEGTEREDRPAGEAGEDDDAENAKTLKDGDEASGGGDDVDTLHQVLC